MNITHLRLTPALFVLLFALGCSKQPPDASSGQSAGAVQGAAADDDARAMDILKSPDIVEARDWVRRYPKSLFSADTIAEDAEGGTPLGPIVERLFTAGAQRVVVHHASGKMYLGLIVVLPSDPAARQKVFALEPQLSQLCQQREAKDQGQKYLYYTPD